MRSGRFGPAIIVLIGRKLLWFIELERLYPDEDRPWRSRLIGCCSSASIGKFAILKRWDVDEVA
jgi:hypothetical protein